MSLTVTVVVRRGTEAEAEDELPAGPLAAGFESWRTQVWGAACVRDLGAKYFPQLARADLHVRAGEMTAFLSECALLRMNLESIAAAVDLSSQTGVAVDTASGRVVSVAASRETFREQVSLRLSNIETAARMALTAGAELAIE